MNSPLFFDSHAHLDDRAFDPDRENVIKGLSERDVHGFVNVSSTAESCETSLRLAEQYPNVWFAAGIHPSECGELSLDFLKRISELLSHPKCVALGEIGLDYHYEDDVPKEIQRLWFEKQCALAAERDIPVIIHDRDAHEECLETVKKYRNRGVFHCFSGSAEMALELVRLGFYISFTGVLTFKNAKKTIRACEAVPLSRLMIETDCPYMAPEPYRGNRNDPGYVRYTCEKLAEIKGIPVEEAASATSENARILFGISQRKGAET